MSEVLNIGMKDRRCKIHESLIKIGLRFVAHVCLKYVACQVSFNYNQTLTNITYYYIKTIVLSGFCH